MTRMKNENDKLQASMRHLTGEDLTTLTMGDLHQLEQQLEMSVNRVRSRKVYVVPMHLCKMIWQLFTDVKFSILAKKKKNHKTIDV